MHIVISGFYDACFNSQKFLIAFINDYTRYMHPYFFMKKSETCDAFKVYNAEVENQLFKQIKTRGQIEMVNIMASTLKGYNYKVHL
jgi:hypothetical protein